LIRSKVDTNLIKNCAFVRVCCRVFQFVIFWMKHSSQFGKAVLKSRVRCMATALVVALGYWSLGAHAFTLGDLRGSAVIGRALDVSVEMRAGDGEDVSASCLAADVYYAEAQQNSPIVSVNSPVATSSQRLVRVQLAEVVSEPIITVLLRSTCGSSNMRRFVLFADLPQGANVNLPNVDVAGSGSLLSAAAASAAVLATPLVVLPQSNTGASQSGKSKSAKTVATNKSKSKTGKSKKLAVGPAGSSDLNLKKEAARPAGKSLLKLDPMEQLSDRIDSLGSVMLFASTEDALLQTKQISTLESDMKALRALAAKNDAKLLELRTQLEQAQAQQIPSLLIYGLGALVLLSLAGFVWVLQRQRRVKHDSEAWWHDPDEAESTVLMSRSPDSKFSPVQATPATPVVPVAVAPVVSTRPASVAVKPAVSTEKSNEKPPVKPVQEVDLNIDLDHFMLSNAGGRQPSADDGSAKRATTVHHFNAESILDIRQQAEFFVSLGQTERAQQLLQKQILESAEPNPLVYLDLISLYHSLGLKADFQEQSEAFHRHFNCLLPAFSEFNREGADLESYPDVLTALVKHWPSANALAFLDASIFLDPKAPPQLPFDLAAFRDLLTLHALADAITPDQSATETVPLSMTAVTVTKSEAPEPLAVAAKPSIAQDESNRDPVPAVPIAQPVPVAIAKPELDMSLIDSESLPDTPVQESPSRMLDLDFSTLTAPGKLEEEAQPLKTPPVRYATRSRWPVTKKPGTK
jgi:hypothetical protein